MCPAYLPPRLCAHERVCVYSETPLKVDFQLIPFNLLLPTPWLFYFLSNFQCCGIAASCPASCCFVFFLFLSLSSNFFIFFWFAWSISGPHSVKLQPAQLSRIGWRRYPFRDVNKSVTSLTAQFISSRSNLPVHAECFDDAASVCVCVCAQQKRERGGERSVRKMCQLALWRFGCDYRREMLSEDRAACVRGLTVSNCSIADSVTSSLAVFADY